MSVLKSGKRAGASSKTGKSRSGRYTKIQHTCRIILQGSIITLEESQLCRILIGTQSDRVILQMFEFPSSRNAWRLDIVSILAVLGESNIKIHTQAITASKLCLLPRLLPAPQALLREARPKRLPYVEEARVYSVRSGRQRDGLNFIPNLIHKIETLPPYTVQLVTIDYQPEYESVLVTNRRLAPLNLLAIASCLLFIGLMVWSILLRDGVALIGILLMSFASSALDYASYWSSLNFPRNAQEGKVLDDIVISTRWGAFVVVRCHDAIARELYWGSEECQYSSSTSAGRILGGVIGGLMVLIAVVLFANCSSWEMQAAIGTMYAFLNVVYWLVTAIPEAWSWDLRCYAVHADRISEYHKRSRTFTSALSTAIKLTQSVVWVKQNRIMPPTDAWDAWLEQAESHLTDDSWDPEAALSDCLRNNLHGNYN